MEDVASEPATSETPQLKGDVGEEEVSEVVLGPGWRCNVTADDVPKRKDHTTWYLITTTNPDHSREWTQHRRYSELRELRRQLGNKYRGFPSRLISNNGSIIMRSPSCLQDKLARARDLADWLQGIISRAPELDPRGIARLHAVLGLPMGMGARSIVLSNSKIINDSPAANNNDDDELIALQQDLENERAAYQALAKKSDADIAATVAENAKLASENEHLRKEIDFFKPKPPLTPPPSAKIALCCTASNGKRHQRFLNLRVLASLLLPTS